MEKGCQIISIKATKRHYRNWGLGNAEFYSHLEDFGVFFNLLFKLSRNIHKAYTLQIIYYYF